MSHLPVVYILSRGKPIPGGLEYEIDVQGTDRLYHLAFDGFVDLKQEKPFAVELEIMPESPGTRWRHDDLGMVVAPGRYLMRVAIPKALRGLAIKIQPRARPWSLLDELAEASN